MGPRFARYLAFAGLTALVGATLYAELTHRGVEAGVRAGEQIPPFAAPLAQSGSKGDVNIATRPHEGQAGSRPACTVRGQGILNVCQLYERGPVVLALFIDAGSCTSVLGEMQRLAPTFPGVRFAAVAVKGDPRAVSKLAAAQHVSFPVGIDRDAILVGLYRMVSCPQITFSYPGGVAQGAPLIDRQPLPTLRARVGRLVADSRARGWRGT